MHHRVVIGITGAFIGMILALETFVQFEALGLQGTMGSIINVSVVKQIGPVLAAVMVVLALMTSPGLQTALDGLLPIPELGRNEVIAPA